MTPFRVPSLLPWLYPNLLWRVPTNEKNIYLTFDDGPIPGPTEWVLDQLRDHRVQATFFCIGDNVQKHHQVFSRILAEGHAVGNHTFHHIKGWRTNTQTYLENVERCQQAIAPKTTPFFRPPYGQISRRQIQELRKQYRIVMWDVLTQDYDASRPPEKCLRGSIRATRPGSIVVFHDSLKAERNLKFTLPRYLDHFQQLGYAFRLLPGLP